MEEDLGCPSLDETGDIILLCEFCEISGASVLERFPPMPDMDSHSPNFSNFISLEKESIEEFIRCRLFSCRLVGDGVNQLMPGNRADFSQTSSLYMDNIEWKSFADPSTRMAACIFFFSIPDVYARGYCRNTCLCYLSSDTHKMKSISTWIVYELEHLAWKLIPEAEKRHKQELRTLYSTLRYFTEAKQHQSADFDELSPREKTELEVELAAITRRIAWAEREKTTAAVPHPQLAPPSMRRHQSTSSDDSNRMSRSPGSTLAYSSSDRFDTPNNLPITASASKVDDEPVSEKLRRMKELITLRGSRKLRNLENLCGSPYLVAANRLKVLLNIYSMPYQDLLELSDDYRAPLDDLHRGKTLLSQVVGCTSSIQKRRAFFCKIGSCVVVEPFFLSNPGAVSEPHTNLCFLDSVALTDEGKFCCLQQWMPQIPDIAFYALRGLPVVVCGSDCETVKIGTSFVEHFIPAPQLRTATFILPWSEKREIIPYDLSRASVVGCFRDAILDASNVPLLPRVAVWLIDGTTSMFICAEHYRLHNSSALLRKASMLPLKSSEGLLSRIPQFAHCIFGESFTQTPHLRFYALLKMILSEYGLMASLCIQHFAAEASLPSVLTPFDICNALEKYYGYRTGGNSVHRDDADIIRHLVRIMLHAARRHQSAVESSTAAKRLELDDNRQPQGASSSVSSNSIVRSFCY